MDVTGGRPRVFDAVAGDQIRILSTDPGRRKQVGEPGGTRRAWCWQRRFWEHTIRDDRDYAAHTDYIHFNPVKHGLAARARDWPYSSFHKAVKSGLYPADWAADSVELNEAGE